MRLWPCFPPSELAVPRKSRDPLHEAAARTHCTYRNFTSGIAVALVVLFCLVDPAIILESETGLPIVDMIYRATGSRAAATVIALMLSVCFVNGTNGSTTSVSRLLYSMARDKGIFFHDFFSHLHPKWNVPIRTIMLSFVFNVLFGLLYLGPAVAFNAYISSCTIFLNVSYAFPVIMVLIRGRKVLDQFQTAETPFKLGRIRGLILNWISATYVVFISIVSTTLSFLFFRAFFGSPASLLVRND